MILLARTNPDVKTNVRAELFFAMKGAAWKPMPIKKLTGSMVYANLLHRYAHFRRLPDGGGRRRLAFAMQTLEYERGARAGQASGHVMTILNPKRYYPLAREAKLNGKPAIDDPAVQEELVA